jgi:hypothetical protein
MRRDFLRGEFPRHVANRNLILVESELHPVSAPVLLKPTMELGRTCRHCEERSDEAIQRAAKKEWIASLRSQ